ncbi:MAG: TRAP transporter small permease [Betaproteobacteria bacterium]|nr:TRAP transporter small permease [Betaproteobacteria bacterium]
MRSLWRAFARALAALNLWMGYAAGVLVALSSVILTWEVLARYFLDRPTDWALELCIYMLIASTFLAAGHTLAAKAHVNIDIVDHLMSGAANRWRMLLADLGAAGLCGFVAANAWRLTAVAYREGWVANSIWSPKLWIPFAFIALGMSLLALQYLAQIVDGRLVPILRGGRDGRA